MKLRIARIAAAVAALLFTIQLSAQNPANPIQVALKRWYPANVYAAISLTCSGIGGMAFDGAHMWVSCQNSYNIQEFNSSDGALVRTVSLGSPNAPDDLVYDGVNIWVAEPNSDRVVKVAASTGAILGTYSLGTGVSYMAFDGQYVWVGGINSIIKVLPSTGAYTAYPLTSCTPYGMAFDGSHIWVSCYVGNNTGTTVLELNSTGGVVATVTVGSNPEGLAFDGTNIWVADEASNAVSRINIGTLAVSSFTVGCGPVRVVFDTTYIWVADACTAAVNKLQASSGTIVGTFFPPSSVAVLAFDGGNI